MTKLKIKGMHCQSCQMLIEDALDDIGVKSKVNLKNNSITIENTDVPLEKITKVIESEGYKVTKWNIQYQFKGWHAKVVKK